MTGGYKGRLICSFLWHSAGWYWFFSFFFFFTCLEILVGHCVLCIGGEVKGFS